MSNDSLGDRMKWYEEVPRHRLCPQVPVMMRLDGKAFHTLTSRFEKPVDARMQKAMLAAAMELCRSIQDVRLAYVQSDEITLLITQRTPFSQAWFDLDVQKMVSVSASMCSVAFGRSLAEQMLLSEFDQLPTPLFDSRVWNLPVHEVCNNLIWRQQDATRNSIQSLGRAYFSHRALENKSCDQIQNMLMRQFGINWNDCPTIQKRGACIVQRFDRMCGAWSGWVVDEEIPIFTQDRNYVECRVRILEDQDRPGECLHWQKVKGKL